MELSYSVVEVVVYTVNLEIEMLAKERSTLSGFTRIKSLLKWRRGCR